MNKTVAKQLLLNRSSLVQSNAKSNESPQKTFIASTRESELSLRENKKNDTDKEEPTFLTSKDSKSEFDPPVQQPLSQKRLRMNCCRYQYIDLTISEPKAEVLEKKESDGPYLLESSDLGSNTDLATPRLVEMSNTLISIGERSIPMEDEEYTTVQIGENLPKRPKKMQLLFEAFKTLVPRALLDPPEDTVPSFTWDEICDILKTRIHRSNNLYRTASQNSNLITPNDLFLAVTRGNPIKELLQKEDLFLNLKFEDYENINWELQLCIDFLLFATADLNAIKGQLKFLPSYRNEDNSWQWRGSGLKRTKINIQGIAINQIPGFHFGEIVTHGAHLSILFPKGTQQIEFFLEFLNLTFTEMRKNCSEPTITSKIPLVTLTKTNINAIQFEMNPPFIQKFMEAMEVLPEQFKNSIFVVFRPGDKMQIEKQRIQDAFHWITDAVDMTKCSIRIADIRLGIMASLKTDPAVPLVVLANIDPMKEILKSREFLDAFRITKVPQFQEYPLCNTTFIANLDAKTENGKLKLYNSVLAGYKDKVPFLKKDSIAYLTGVGSIVRSSSGVSDSPIKTMEKDIEGKEQQKLGEEIISKIKESPCGIALEIGVDLHSFQQFAKDVNELHRFGNNMIRSLGQPDFESNNRLLGVITAPDFAKILQAHFFLNSTIIYHMLEQEILKFRTVNSRSRYPFSGIEQHAAIAGILSNSIAIFTGRSPKFTKLGNEIFKIEGNIKILDVSKFQDPQNFCLGLNLVDYEKFSLVNLAIEQASQSPEIRGQLRQKFKATREQNHGEKRGYVFAKQIATESLDEFLKLQKEVSSNSAKKHTKKQLELAKKSVEYFENKLLKLNTGGTFWGQKLGKDFTVGDLVIWKSEKTEFKSKGGYHTESKSFRPASLALIKMLQTELPEVHDLLLPRLQKSTQNSVLEEMGFFEMKTNRAKQKNNFELKPIGLWKPIITEFENEGKKPTFVVAPPNFALENHKFEFNLSIQHATPKDLELKRGLADLDGTNSFANAVIQVLFSIIPLKFRILAHGELAKIFPQSEVIRELFYIFVSLEKESMTDWLGLKLAMMNENVKLTEGDPLDFMDQLVELLHQQIPKSLADRQLQFIRLVFRSDYSKIFECSECDHETTEHSERIYRLCCEVSCPTSLSSFLDVLTDDRECHLCNKKTRHTGGIVCADLFAYGLCFHVKNPQRYAVNVPEFLRVAVDNGINSYRLVSFVLPTSSKKYCTYRRVAEQWYRCEDDKTTLVDVKSVSEISIDACILFYGAYDEVLSSSVPFQSIMNNAFPSSLPPHSILERSWFVGQLYQKLPPGTWVGSFAFDSMFDIWRQVFPTFDFRRSTHQPRDFSKLISGAVQFLVLVIWLRDHWTCLVCWKVNETIFGSYFDSLAGPIPKELRAVCRSLEESYDHQLKISTIVDQTRQPDGDSCGFYVLFFLERLLQMYTTGSTRSGLPKPIETVIGDVIADLNCQINFESDSELRVAILNCLKREFYSNYTIAGLISVSPSTEEMLGQYETLFQYTKTNKSAADLQKKHQLTWSPIY